MCRFLASCACFQAVLGALEIGAGILPVGIEEELEEAGVEIVMVGDVAPGVLRLHRSGELRPADAQERQRRDVRRADAAQPVALQERDEVVDGAFLDEEPAVHEELAELQRRVESEQALRAFVGKADRERRFRAVAVALRAARGERHGQRSGAHEAGKCRGDKRFHRANSRGGAGSGKGGRRAHNKLQRKSQTFLYHFPGYPRGSAPLTDSECLEPPDTYPPSGSWRSARSPPQQLAAAFRRENASTPA